MNWKPITARILGNFIISFLSPLTGLSLFAIDFHTTIMASVFTAIIMTGISIGRELTKYGTENERKRRA